MIATVNWNVVASLGINIIDALKRALIAQGYRIHEPISGLSDPWLAIAQDEYESLWVNTRDQQFHTVLRDTAKARF